MNTQFEQINLNLLLSLDALFSEKNVTRAAKKLGVTQSAMSRNLASLRTLLNDELLVRVGNEMQPTPYALSIEDGLRRNLADLKRLVRTGGAFDPKTAQGTLRIAAPGHIAGLVAVDLVEKIQSEAPNLRLRIEQLDAANISYAIAEGVDLALGPMLDLGSSVSGTLLCRDDFACLVRTDHPCVDLPTARGDVFDLDRYLDCDHILISPTGRGGSLVDDLLRQTAPERRRRVVAEVQSFLLAPAIVAQTSLVLTAPRSSLVEAARTLPVKIVTAPLELQPLTIAAYWDPTRDSDARVQWVLDSVRCSLKERL